MGISLFDNAFLIESGALKTAAVAGRESRRGQKDEMAVLKGSDESNELISREIMWCYFSYGSDYSRQNNKKQKAQFLSYCTVVK